MLGWLYRIIIGNFHLHKWEIIKEGGVYTSSSAKQAGAIPCAHFYYLQCQICGDVKKRQF